MRDPKKGDWPKFDAELGSLRSEIEGSSSATIIISSEEFFATQPLAVQKIAAALQDCSVEIIAVLRRPDELFSSIYNQRMKAPTNRFKTHYTKFLQNPASLAGDMQFERALSVWATAFGWKRIRVECYHSQPDVVDLVLRRMGISLEALAPERAGKINVSLSVKAVEAMWHAKQAGLDEHTLRRLYEAAGHFMVPP